MGDTLSPEDRSRRMSRIRNKDTNPELIVRRAAHRLGFRFRLHRRDLAGCPDLVFPRLRSVIFVHGCFWHRHADENCRLARLPKSRLEFWQPKLTANHLRDLRNQKKLAAAGWRVLVLWECELGKQSEVDAKLRDFLEGRCAQSSCSPAPVA